MTKFGMTWRRGFVLGASLALLVSAVPGATVAQDEGGEVQMLHYYGTELGGEALRAVLTGFEEETGITVAFNDVGHENFKTAVLIQLAGNNPQDIHSYWAGARTANQVQYGLLMPIDDMWAANDFDSQFPAAMVESAVTYDGVKYNLPFGYHLAAMFYNPKVFADAGVTPPTTWDELKTACATFSDAGILPISLGSMNRWPAQFWFDYIMLRTAGPEYRAKLMAGEASYTDPEVVRTLELWRELIDAGCFPDGATANSIDWTDAAAQLGEGTAAMNLMGTWITGYLNGLGYAPVTDYDFFEFPVIDEGVASAVVGPVDGWLVAAEAANPEGTMKLLEYLARPEVQLEWAIGQGALPPNVNADTSQLTPVLQRALEAVNAAETFNFNYDLATPPAPSEVGLSMFQKFINDPSDIEGLMAETQAAVEVAFASE